MVTTRVAPLVTPALVRAWDSAGMETKRQKAAPQPRMPPSPHARWITKDS
jgi:hypothetical protein